MEHFHHAGGVPKLLAQLGDLVDLDAKTITGQTLRDVAAVEKLRRETARDAILLVVTCEGASARYRCFVGNLPFAVTEEELRELFERYGAIASATVMVDETGRPKGFGFVNMESTVAGAKLRR